MEYSFGKNLKRIRTNKNMNQAELAEKIGYKQVTISSWETGRSEPSMGDIAKLSQALECSQEELIGIKKTVGNITFEDILVKINSLSMEELEKLQHAVDYSIKYKKEIEKLEKEKAEHEKRLAEYVKRIEELKGYRNED